jgi:hypothetical protein
MPYKTLHRKLSNMNLEKSGFIELIILHYHVQLRQVVKLYFFIKVWSKIKYLTDLKYSYFISAHSEIPTSTKVKFDQTPLEILQMVSPIKYSIDLIIVIQ